MRVDQAYVSTLGHEVVDTFYVTAPDGAKLTDPDVVTGLEEALPRRALTPLGVRFRSCVMTSCGNARHNIQQSRARILATMITTLRTNFQDPVRRKMFGARLGGKFIGVAIVIGLIYAFAYLFSTRSGQRHAAALAGGVGQGPADRHHQRA